MVMSSSSVVDRHVSSSSPPLMTSSSSNQGSSPVPNSSPASNNVHNGSSNDECIPSPAPSSPMSSARPGSVSPTSSQVMSPSNNNNSSLNNTVLNLTTSSENSPKEQNENNSIKQESICNTENSNENKINNSSTSNNINTSTSSPSAVSTASSSSPPPPPPPALQPSSPPSSVHLSSVTGTQQRCTPHMSESLGHLSSTPVVTSHPHVSPTSTRPLRLRRVNHSDEIVSGFGKLLKNESLTDVTISCSGGINIKAHRIVLSTFSPYFKSIFESSPFIDTPWTYPVIVMKDYGYTELKAIIEFIYKGEVSVPRDKLSSVLATAKSLEVSGLADLKLDTFGINPSSATNSHHHSNGNSNTPAIHGSLPLVNGSAVSSLVGSLTGLKRSSDLETSLFKSSAANNAGSLSHQLHSNSTVDGANNLHDSSGASLAKKLRLLESPTNLATDLSLGATASSSLPSAATGASSLSSLQQLQQYAAASGIDLNSLESVRSLLQQPPRVTSFLQQLRQQTQSPLNNNRSSPTVSNTSSNISGSSPTPTRMSNVSLQQIINSQKAAAAAAAGHQQQQQLSNSARLNPRSLQLQQQHLKQQILQQQLLRSKNFQSVTAGNNNQGQGGLNTTSFPNSGNGALNQRSSVVTNNNTNSQGNNNHIPFMQFQQRIRQQIQEKHRSLALLGQAANNGVTNLSSSKPLLQKHLTLNKDLSKLNNQSVNNLIKVENPVINGVNFSHHLSNHSVADDDEVEVIIKEGDEIKLRDSSNNGPSESQELNQDDEDDHHHQRKGSMNDSLIDNDESPENLVVEEDSDNVNHHHRHHSEGMDPENGRNNSHRTMNDDDEYEIEIDKDAIFQQQQQLRLQQIQKQQQNYQLQLQLEQEEQEQRLLEYHQSLSQATPSSEGDGDQDSSNTGFGFDWQEGFTDDFPHSAKDGMDHQGNGGIGNQRSTPLATPDFLQPRGPGRPRKGNKAQEISPCPECNKVFVRPDVLKLHYRSVHLNERHPCNLCPKIFKWPGDLSKHKRTKHPDKYPPANANNSIVVHH